MPYNCHRNVRFLRPPGTSPQVVTPHINSGSAVEIDPNDTTQYQDTRVRVSAGTRVTLKANTSVSLYAGDGVAGINPDQGTQSLSTSVIVEEGSDIVVERAMYWGAVRSGYGTVNRIEGHASRATPAL